MQIVTAIVFVLLGLAIGSFLNVVIDRLPDRQSLIVPPSHCPACKRRLVLKDLIPVVSYIWLQGRCRYCQTRIPMRLLWVEVGSGAAFGLLYWYFGPSPELAVTLLYFCLLLVIAVIDLNHNLILNRLVYPGIVIVLIVSGFGSSLTIVPGIDKAAIGGAIGLGLFLLIVILSRGGMGLGDVKMAALMGLMLGYPSIITAIFLAVVVGGLVALALMLTGVKGRKQTIPFGPFLALGAMLALFWGSTIWEWYTGFFR